MMDAQLDDAPCGFLTLSSSGTIQQINTTLLDLLGYARAELTGRNIQCLLSVSGRVFYQTHFFPLLTLHNKADEIYFSLRSQSGENVPVLVNAVRRERNGEFVNDCVLIPMRQRDRYEDEILRAKKAAEEAIRAQEKAHTALVTKQAELLRVNAELVCTKNELEQRVAERTQALTHQAFHDTLTNLPNRALFLDRLERALAQAKRTGKAVAVLFVDLDDFKVVNDSLGHEAGDMLLQAVAQRLNAEVRLGDTVARFGGDEFTLLLEEINGSSEAERVAERVCDALRTPVRVSGRELFPSASVGIAILGGEGATPKELLRGADIAMYHAKANGKACYLLFDRSMNDKAIERLELEADLRRGLEQGEFRLYFQPIVDLISGQIREVEALVRWEHPVHGLILPTKFIPIAEESRLIVPLGQWVLYEACRQTRVWRDQYPQEMELVVNVNVSAQQLAHPGLLEYILSILTETGLPSACLKLEVTESIMVADVEAVAGRLSALRNLGIQIAMDDFGTGYSSMAYLSSLPLRTLKIDRSFVGRLGASGEEQAIVRAIITLAKSLGLSVTSEGIETAEQLGYLKSLDCDLGQGFYFSRPVPPEAIGCWLAISEATGHIIQPQG